MTNILEETHITNNEVDIGYSPSPETQKQIDKLLEDDKAQKGRTWSYWEAQRKSDPILYRSPKQSAQRAKDAVALGQAFEDGDFDAPFGEYHGR
jgi:hypothetical protein